MYIYAINQPRVQIRARVWQNTPHKKVKKSKKNIHACSRSPSP